MFGIAHDSKPKFSNQSNHQAAPDKPQSSFEMDVTRSVRPDRIAAYRALGKVLEPLSNEWKIDRPDVPSDTIRAKLRRWYYNEEVIFLTEESQQIYLALQGALEAGNETDAQQASHDLRAATRKEAWSEEAPPATEEV